MAKTMDEFLSPTNTPVSGSLNFCSKGCTGLMSETWMQLFIAVFTYFFVPFFMSEAQAPKITGTGLKLLTSMNVDTPPCSSFSLEPILIVSSLYWTFFLNCTSGVSSPESSQNFSLRLCFTLADEPKANFLP